MRSFDSNTLAALSADSLIVRSLVFVRGKTLAGATKTFGFWNGEDDVSITVTSAIDGASESRTYIGGGSLLAIDPIPLRIGLEVRTINATMSQIYATVQDMVRGNNIRHAVVEIHRALFNVSTGQLVAPPYARFLGKVNTSPVNTPRAGDEGSVVFGCVSNTRELTRANTALKSDETQKLRSGDRARRYVGVAAQWPVWWGEAQGGDS